MTDRQVKTRVLVISGYRGSGHTQGGGPCARLQPVFKVRRHILTA